MSSAVADLRGEPRYTFSRFLQKLCQIIGKRHPLGLAPPLGNPGSATAKCVQNKVYFQILSKKVTCLLLNFLQINLTETSYWPPTFHILSIKF